MPTIEQIDGLIQQAVELQNADITYPALGTIGGFQHAQAAKDDIAKYMLGLLRTARQVIGSVDNEALDYVLEETRQQGRRVGVDLTELAKLAEGDVHTPQFPNQRDSQVRNLQEHGHNFKRAMQPYEAVMRAARAERLVDSTDIDAVVRDLRTRLGDAEKLLAQASKALENVQTKAMVKGVEAAVGTFASLRDTHAKREQSWFLAFVVASVTALAAIGFVVWSTWPIGTPSEIVSVVLRRLLLVSAPVVCMRIALSKYNLERNLRILYDHRETVLGQYRTFETAIGDDVQAKNQFRLAIAQYIFSDPVTGYVASDGSTEININPIVGMLEKLGGGK
jgi:hypothetical protein